MLLVLPNLAVAALLFYIFDNPLAGKTETSWSWWVLFLGVRQPMIFEITRIGQVFWVEILALRSQFFNASESFAPCMLHRIFPRETDIPFTRTIACSIRALCQSGIHSKSGMAVCKYHQNCKLFF